MKNTSKVLSLVLLSLFFTSVSYADFSDVNDQTNYKDSISWMQQNKVINGYENGTFRPDKCVNRAEFLKMLFITLGIDYSKSTADLFSDTPATEWYAPYVRTARENKVINGYEDGTFRPNNCVSRAEAIKITTALITKDKIPTLDWKFGPLDVGMPADVQDSNIWFYKYLEFALKINVVGTKHEDHGDMEKDGPFYHKFFPNDSMTRKEVAEMLYRVKALIDNNAPYYYDPEKIDFYKQEKESYTFYKPTDTRPEGYKISDLDTNNLTYTDSYGFSLVLPKTWSPIKEEDKGPYKQQKAIDTFKMISGDMEVIQIGSVPLYARALNIAVVPIADKAAATGPFTMPDGGTLTPLYTGLLGENKQYAFFYYSDITYMYPYGCKETHSEEAKKLCASYEPAYKETLDVIKSFKPVD